MAAAASETPDEVSLHTLDPSPVEETPLDLKEGYFPPQSTSTLGLSSHGAPYYLHRIQKYSSYTFTVFAALHITNIAILPLVTQSTTAASKYLLLTRPYYQSFPAEPIIVVIPLIAHVASGIALRIHRRRTALKRLGAETRSDRKTIPWPAVSRTSALGLTAVPLVGLHAALLRILPLRVEGGSSGIGLDFVGHGAAIAPKIHFAFYALLVTVTGSHIVWGWAHWLGLSNSSDTNVASQEVQLRKKRQWWAVTSANALIVSVWVAGGLGVVLRNGRVGGWVGRVYDDLYRHVPGLARWV